MKTPYSMMTGIRVAILLGIATPVFAEAPVYDADSLQSSFDGGYQQAQADVPPPPPAPENTFVPIQSQSSSQATTPPPAPAPLSASSSSMSNDQRLRKMEEQLNNLQSGEGSSRVESLQEQVQTLHGQVEELTHQLQQLQSQQKAQYADIDKRLSPTATTGTKSAGMSDTLANNKPAAKATPKAAAVVGAKASTEDQPNVAEEQQIYQTAYNLIKTKKYNEAVDALQGMLKKYPSGQFASNAHYWLGELYGLMGKNDQALTEFTTVINSYSDSPRVSDAQLKVGLIYSAQSKWAEAKNSFKKVASHYPGSASARVANEQLKQIKLAGH